MSDCWGGGGAGAERRAMHRPGARITDTQSAALLITRVVTRARALHRLVGVRPHCGTEQSGAEESGAEESGAEESGAAEWSRHDVRR